MRWIYYEAIVIILTSCYSHPTGVFKKFESDNEIEIQNECGKGHNYYLRDVICLGNSGDVVEAECCSTSISKPWLIILPAKQKIRCSIPDCSQICTTEIIASRVRKMSEKAIQTKKKNKPNRTFTDGCLEYIDNVLSIPISVTSSTECPFMSQQNSSSTISKTIQIPKIVLEILQLCKTAASPKYNSSSELLMMCKPEDISLQELINKMSLRPSSDSSLSTVQTVSNLYTTTGTSLSQITKNMNTKECTFRILPTLPKFPKCIPTKNEENKSSGTTESIHTCCCNCPQKNRMSPNEKMKRLLMAIMSFPKPDEPILKAKLGAFMDASQVTTEKLLVNPKFKDANSVESYVSAINKQYMRVFSQYKQAAWEYETNITHYTRQKAMETALALTHYQRNMNIKLDFLHNTYIDDPVILRQIKLLYIPGMSILPGIQWNEFEQVLYGMETVYASAGVNKWNKINEKVTLSPVIMDVMATSKHPDELKHYWVEWRNATGRKLRSLFDQYVSLMALTAQKNGFRDASEMWASKYETEDFIDSLAGHWEEIRPLYSELHALVRHELHQLYGEINGALDSGKILAHLTGDIWGQNWKNLYNIVTPLKTNREIKRLIQAKFRKKLTPKEMANSVEKSFTTLGFSKFSEKFWKESIFEKKNDTDMNCEASAWDMYTDSDYSKSNTEEIEVIHHQMAMCEYFKEYSSLPFIFRDGPNPGFQDGIAGAIVLSYKTRNYKKILKIPITKSNTDTEIEGLLQLALEKVSFLPYSYIIDLWRHKVFRGEIDKTNYNSKWWELRSRYQGLKPSVNRTEEDFDVGSKLHIAANKPYIKYFVSALMEFQIHEALCRKINYTGAIHKCDFTSSLEAGKVLRYPKCNLRNVMGKGASVHWKVAMEEMTGARRLDSTPLLRYFQPLYQWLKEKNTENNVIAGWDI